MKRFAFLASLALAISCGDDTSGTGTEGDETGNDVFGPGCTPGVPVACTCPDGSAGEQTCLAGGELAGCECGGGTTMDPTATGTTTTTTGPTTTGPDTESTSSSTGDTDTTGVVPGCGNGVVEDDEQCDDDNDVDDDACSNECIASCGVEWLNVDTTTDGQGMAVAVDPDGDFIIATAAENGDLIVEKYMPDGTLDWSNAYTLDEDAEPASITTFGSDQIFVGGRYGSGPDTIFAMRLSGEGVEAGGNWPVEIGTADGGHVAVDSTGRLILVGWLTGADNLGARKYNTDGTIFWTYANDVGAGLPDFGRAVAVDGNDNFLIGVDVVDVSDSTPRVLQIPPGTESVQPTSNWNINVGQIITDDGATQTDLDITGVATDSSDDVMVSVTTGSGEANTWDFWVLEFNSAGQPQWISSGDELSIPGDGRAIHGITSTTAGAVGLSGVVDDGGASILTVRLDTSGDLLCNRATTDAMLSAGFTVTGPGGNLTTGTMAIGGSDGSSPPNPWLARFRQ